jgi:anti-anti-sigma factor
MARERGNASVERANGLGIISEREGEIWVLNVAGELDVASAGALEVALLEAMRDGGSKVLVDLSECEFIDSSGVRALILGNRALRGDGNAEAELVLAAARDQVSRVLTLVGVDERLPVVPSRAQALERLG